MFKVSTGSIQQTIDVSTHKDREGSEVPEREACESIETLVKIIRTGYLPKKSNLCRLCEFNISRKKSAVLLNGNIEIAFTLWKYAK